MGGVAFAVYSLMSFLIGRAPIGDYFVNLISVVITVSAAVAVYGLVLVRSGGVDRQELAGMPGGRRIVAILEKLRILR